MQKGRKRWLLIVLSFVALYLVWGIWTHVSGSSPIRWTSTKTVPSPGGIEVRTTALHEVVPFVVSSELIIPFPFHHVEEGYEQTVLVSGRERARFTHADLHVYPSPSGDYFVTENNLFTTPPRIYHAQSSADFSWDKDEVLKGLPEHPYMVTFQFVQWVDEDHFLLEVQGRGMSANCRQTWLVDASTGSHEPSTSTARPAIRPWG